MNIRVGQGIDFHRLQNGLKLMIGGVEIPSQKGCVAHSDGDVLLHSICDALLGAAGLQDIGFYFPDSSAEFRNIASTILLERTCKLISEEGFKVINIDCTLCLERPKISPFVQSMKKKISSITGISSDYIGIKATTTEKMGFVGREEGVMASTVVLLGKL